MKAALDTLIASAIPALIMFVGVASWGYLLTGNWPPQYILIGSSIGGILSPHLWAFIHRVRGKVGESEPPESLE
jgi:hypothetical protein